MAVQTQLFKARKSALSAELAAGQQAISGLEAQASSVRQMLENRRAQQALQTKQAQGVRALADEGFAPRNQALQLEQAQAEMRSSITDLEANRARSLSSAAEVRLRMAQRQQDYLKEVSQQLSDVRREVQANQVRLAAIVDEVSRLQIRAPIDGQVIGLQVTGVGGVVSPGQHLMDILPRGEALLLDVKLPPQSIDRVKLGDPVEVRFSAFANTPQLVVDAKLVKLAGDSVAENVGGSIQTYYIGRVQITPDGLKALGSHQLQPGMSAEVLVRTGQRSLLTYLLHPMLKRVAASMKEE
jgi:protease secretion system membrane fusion protein